MLDEVLNRVTAPGLKSSLKKMQILKKEVDFLGLAFTCQNRSLSSTMRAPTENLMTTTHKTVRDVQVILGTLNYIRPLVPNFSKLAKTLYETTKVYANNA